MFVLLWLRTIQRRRRHSAPLCHPLDGGETGFGYWILNHPIISAPLIVAVGIWAVVTVLKWAMPLYNEHPTLVQVLRSEVQWFWELMHRIV